MRFSFQATAICCLLMTYIHSASTDNVPLERQNAGRNLLFATSRELTVKPASKNAHIETTSITRTATRTVNGVTAEATAAVTLESSDRPAIRPSLWRRVLCGVSGCCTMVDFVTDLGHDIATIRGDRAAAEALRIAGDSAEAAAAAAAVAADGIDDNATNANLMRAALTGIAEATNRGLDIAAENGGNRDTIHIVRLAADVTASVVRGRLPDSSSNGSAASISSIAGQNGSTGGTPATAGDTAAGTGSATPDVVDVVV